MPRYGAGLPPVTSATASAAPAPAAPAPAIAPAIEGPPRAARYGPGLPNPTQTAPPVAAAAPVAPPQPVTSPPPIKPSPPVPLQPLPYARPGLPGLPTPAPASAFAPAPSAQPLPAPASVPASSLEVGRLRHAELAAVLDLVNADLLPGQPACTRRALDMALRGECSVDARWWKELANAQVVVARRGDAVVGAASYAVAPADRSGWLLWLHAREDRATVEALLDHVLGDLTGSSHLYAFWIATALSLGLEALPVERRQMTHEVLLSRGLVGRDSWRYLVLSLDRAQTERVGEETASVTPISNPGEAPAWRLTISDGEEPVAAAEIAVGPYGCGVLWWIDVEPSQRGRGIGGRLLGQALRFLRQRGARTVAAFVDHDDPRERDPRPVLRLLGAAGFDEVDRLWSYESPRRKR
jgi:GNAT superfamily N-acetyltransferase